MTEITPEALKIKKSRNPKIQASVGQEIMKLYSETPNLSFVEVNSLARDRVAGQIIRTRLRQEVKAAKEMSMTDELTGLHNRRWFEDELKKRIAMAKRNKQDLYLLYIDFDNFKEVNTTYGHSGGDAVLKLAAQIKTRPDEPISRNGGDEFVQLMGHEGIDLKEIAFATERHRTNVSNNSRTLLEKAPVAEGADPKTAVRITTLTIGVAKYQGEDPKEFIRKANEALLFAKTQKKDTAFIAKTNSNGTLTFTEVKPTK